MPSHESRYGDKPVFWCRHCHSNNTVVTGSELIDSMIKRTPCLPTMANDRGTLARYTVRCKKCGKVDVAMITYESKEQEQ